jgi:2-(1,2-epoxy-1,2-dihydrophenyl)acetyl-CoA isomerase
MSLVSYQLADGIAILTMNRPEALNALNGEMIVALETATARAAADSDARVVILRSSGDHFMAGGDLKWFATEIAGRAAGDVEARMNDRLAQVHATTRNIRHMDKPVIAAVRGAAAGYGMSLMMACDFALAADSAYFTLAYCHIALSPDGGATWALPRLVGLKKATEIALLGERFDTQTALGLGLINRAVPAASLDEVGQRPAESGAGPGAGPDQGAAQPVLLEFAGNPTGGRAGKLRPVCRRAGLRRGTRGLCREAQTAFRLNGFTRQVFAGSASLRP